MKEQCDYHGGTHLLPCECERGHDDRCQCRRCAPVKGLAQLIAGSPPRDMSELPGLIEQTPEAAARAEARAASVKAALAQWFTNDQQKREDIISHL